MSDARISQDNLDTGSLDGYEGQGDSADTISGSDYEDLLDEGFTTREREPNAERFDNEEETLEERFHEEVPDNVPGSAYGPPADQAVPAPRRDADRVGRLVAPDEGAHEDREKDLVARDSGFSGGASSAEEAAMHVTDEERQRFDDCEDYNEDDEFDE